MLDRFQEYALGHLPHQFVEQVHGLHAVGLQRFDHLLAGEQRRNLVLHFLDLVDLLVELGDLRLHELVAVVLRADALLIDEPHGRDNHDAERRGHPAEDRKMGACTLAPLLAVRQQVDFAAHTGSNLRIARPQATISEGASCIRRLSWILGEVCIAPKGFATKVGTWVRV